MGNLRGKIQDRMHHWMGLYESDSKGSEAQGRE